MHYHPTVIPSNVSTSTPTPEPTPRTMVDLGRPLPVKPPWLRDTDPADQGDQAVDSDADAGTPRSVEDLADNAIVRSAKLIQKRYRGHQSRNKYASWYQVLDAVRCMYQLKSKASKFRSRLRWGQLRQLENTATFTRINHHYYHDLQVSMLNQLDDMKKKGLNFLRDVNEKVTQKVGTDGKKHADLLTEGNAAYYEESALIQRHVIEKDAGIRWITTKYYNMLATPKFSYNRSVKKPAYVELYLTISKCLVADYHRMKCLEAIEKDWLSDASPGVAKASAKANEEVKKSHPSNWQLGQQGLHLSLFELADMWVDSVDPFEYKMFLVMLYMAVTKRDADSGRPTLAKVTELHCLLDGDGNVALPELTEAEMADGAEELGVEVMEQAIATSDRVKRESNWTEEGIMARKMHDEIRRRELARLNDKTELNKRKARMARYHTFLKELQDSVQERLRQDLHWLTVRDELSRTTDAETNPLSTTQVGTTWRGGLLRLALGTPRGEELDLQDIKITNHTDLSHEESELIRLGQRRTRELDRQAAKEYNALQQIFPDRLRTHPTMLGLTQLLELFRFTASHSLPDAVVDALYHGNISVHDLTALDGTASYRSNEHILDLAPADEALLHAAVAVQRGSDTIDTAENKKNTELSRHVRRTAKTLAKHSITMLHKGVGDHVSQKRPFTGYRQRTFVLHDRIAPPMNSPEKTHMEQPFGPWGTLRRVRSPERTMIRPGFKSQDGRMDDPEIHHLLPSYHLKRHAVNSMKQARAVRTHVPHGTAHWKLRALSSDYVKNSARTPEGSMIAYSSLPAQRYGVQAKKKVERPPDDPRRFSPEARLKPPEDDLHSTPRWDMWDDTPPPSARSTPKPQTPPLPSPPRTPPPLSLQPQMTHPLVLQKRAPAPRPRTPLKGVQLAVTNPSASSISKVQHHPSLYLGSVPKPRPTASKARSRKLRSVFRSVAAANLLRKNAQERSLRMTPNAMQALLVKSRELSHKRSMHLETW